MVIIEITNITCRRINLISSGGEFGKPYLIGVGTLLSFICEKLKYSIKLENMGNSKNIFRVFSVSHNIVKKNILPGDFLSKINDTDVSKFSFNMIRKLMKISKRNIVLHFTKKKSRIYRSLYLSSESKSLNYLNKKVLHFKENSLRKNDKKQINKNNLFICYE
tara:strand:- start:58 stop:546 length:489 start_codon:yes stop_codon:yes gene_type:complete